MWPLLCVVYYVLYVMYHVLCDICYMLGSAQVLHQHILGGGGLSQNADTVDKMFLMNLLLLCCDKKLHFSLLWFTTTYLIYIAWIICNYISVHNRGCCHGAGSGGVWELEGESRVCTVFDWAVDRISSGELHHLQQQTRDLAASNYKTFIQTSNCSKEIFQESANTEQHLEKLIQKLPDFTEKSGNWPTKDNPG